MRGCSQRSDQLRNIRRVVPAHAGMFPLMDLSPKSCRSGPRACGDVPGTESRSYSGHQWSPRKRGCSLRHRRRDLAHGVVPAHAGMFPADGGGRSHDGSGPRACGDVPRVVDNRGAPPEWSPRMRGCSLRAAPCRRRSWVVPAHAGMFPTTPRRRLQETSGPRACGDVAQFIDSFINLIAWSPRMRGCSLGQLRRVLDDDVVPAHAGMFPTPPSWARSGSGGPRACGDVPLLNLRYLRGIGWSPRMRGCSLKRLYIPEILFVVPAHAGMFPTLKTAS